MSKKMYRMPNRQTRTIRTAMLATAVSAAVLTQIKSSADAAQYVYSPAGTTDQWSAGTNWSFVPVSAANTRLTFVGSNATVVADGQVSTSNNDVAGNFLLNILDLQGTGPAVTDSSVAITGNTLQFIADGATLPVINLNALDGAQDLDYSVGNALTLSSNTTVTGAGTAGFGFAGSISGAGSLTKSGLSTLVLSGSNNYAGGTTVNGGTLRATQLSALPGYNVAGKVAVNSGGTLSVSAAGAGQWTDVDIDALRANATFAVGSTLGLNVDTGNTLAYASNVGGALGLAKTGAGTLVLSGTNTYAGGTTVGGGVMSVSSASNFGGATSAINFTGGVLRVTGTGLTNLNTNTVNATTFSGGFDIADAGNTFTFSQSISGSGALSKTGPGTLILTGTNTHTGQNTFTGGTLVVNNASQLGSGLLLWGSATLTSTLQVTSGVPVTFTNDVTVDSSNSNNTPAVLNSASNVTFTGTLKNDDANGRIDNANAGTTATFSGPVHISTNASVRRLRFGGPGNIVISGVISNGTAGATTGNLQYQGTGTLTLSNANTYVGVFDHTSGTVVAANAGAFSSGTVNFGTTTAGAGSATLRAGGGPITLANLFVMNTNATNAAIIDGPSPLTFSGTFTNRANNGVLNINSAALTTFSGTVNLSNDASIRNLRLGGTGNTLISGVVTAGGNSLTQQGTGTVTLTNGANSHSGNTNVFSGTLAIGHNAALGTSTLVLGNNTALATVVASGGPRTIANNVSLSSSATFPGVIAGSQNLTVNGTFTNGNSHGYLSVTNAGSTTLAGSVYLSENTATARSLHVTGDGNLLISGAIANANGTGLPGGLEYDGTGTLTLTGTNTYTGGTLVNSGTVQVSRMHAGNVVFINGGATLRVLESSPGLSSGHPAGNDASVSQPSSLTIAAGATLDVTNNDVILDYTGASPVATYEALVASAYNVGVGDWSGTGITSSVAQADGNYVVAIADNAALAAPFGTANGGPLFAGVDVDIDTILIKFTHRADVDLDGVITPNDAAIFGGNYSENDPAVWATGDMDYDGIYTPNDAAIFGGFYDESLASLPEPASCGGLALLCLIAARRRN